MNTILFENLQMLQQAETQWNSLMKKIIISEHNAIVNEDASMLLLSEEEDSKSDNKASMGTKFKNFFINLGRKISEFITKVRAKWGTMANKFRKLPAKDKLIKKIEKEIKKDKEIGLEKMKDMMQYSIPYIVKIINDILAKKDLLNSDNVDNLTQFEDEIKDVNRYFSTGRGNQTSKDNYIKSGSADWKKNIDATYDVLQNKYPTVIKLLNTYQNNCNKKIKEAIKACDKNDYAEIQKYKRILYKFNTIINEFVVSINNCIKATIKYYKSLMIFGGLIVKKVSSDDYKKAAEENQKWEDDTKEWKKRQEENEKEWNKWYDQFRGYSGGYSGSGENERQEQQEKKGKKSRKARQIEAFIARLNSFNQHHPDKKINFKSYDELVKEGKSEDEIYEYYKKLVNENAKNESAMLFESLNSILFDLIM